MIVHICSFLLSNVACAVPITPFAAQVPERMCRSLSPPRPFLSFARGQKDKLWTLKALGLEDAKKMTEAIISRLIKSDFPNFSVLHGQAHQVRRKASNYRGMLKSFWHKLNKKMMTRNRVLLLNLC